MIDTQGLINLIRLSDSDLIKKLKKLNPTKTDGLNYFFYDRGTPVVIVAHLDTVRKFCPIVKQYKVLNETYIKADDTILGADDRVGIYLAIELLTRKDISVLITNFEESGGIGAKKAATEIKFNNKLFIEIDRHGTGHYVTYSKFSKNFYEWMNLFEIKRETGTFSDVLFLTEKTKIPHINISCGYYNEHTAKEYLIVEQMEWTYKKVIEIIEFMSIFPKDVTVENDFYSPLDFNYNDTVFLGDIVEEYVDYILDEYGCLHNRDEIVEQLVSDNKLKDLLEKLIINLIN